MKKIPILATGLSGLVGSRIRELTGDVFHWTDLSLAVGIDITNPDQLEKTFSLLPAKAVIHLAAFTDLDAAWKEKGKTDGRCYQVNVTGTQNIVSACKKYGKYLVHVSTDSVFSGRQKRAYTETDSPDPIEWYGETKFLAEKIVQNSGIDSCIIRLAYPFRASFPLKPDFIHKIINRLAQKRPLEMFSDTVFTPTFIDDIAAAVKIIIEKKPSGIYHIVGSTFISPFQAAQKIAKTFGLNHRLINKISIKDYLKDGARPYPQYAAISNRKAKDVWGITMRAFPPALKIIKAQKNL